MKNYTTLHFSQVSGGGVERYIKLLLKYSNQENFKHYIVSPNVQSYTEFNDKIINLFEFNSEQSFSLLKLLRNVSRFRKILKKTKPDIIYLHSTFAGVIGRLASIGLKSKVVYNPHGWSFQMNVSKYRKFFYKTIEAFLSIFTDKFIMISKSEYDLAKSINISEDKLELIFNGVDLNTLEYTESKNRVSELYTIGMVGRISEQKNPFFFLEFAKNIYDINPKTFFIIVGDGEQRGLLEDKIKAYKLENNFLITGWVYNPEFYISSFDQAVLFSKWEGFGLATAEYMLHKKPIIISDVDGMSELIINNVTGIKIPKEDLGSAVEKSILIRKDKAFAEKIGKNAYKRVKENFSIEDKIKQLEKSFINILG